MLQAFAHQGGSAGGGAEQETLGACVGRRPGEIAHPLQPEHGVEDIERDRRDIVVAVGGASGDPGRYRTGFVDAFLQNLAVFGLFIVAELPGVLRGIQLAEPGMDANLAEQAFHAERARLVRHDGHDQFADVDVFEQRAEDINESHGGRHVAFAAALQEAVEAR